MAGSVSGCVESLGDYFHIQMYWFKAYSIRTANLIWAVLWRIRQELKNNGSWAQCRHTHCEWFARFSGTGLGSSQAVDEY